MSVTTPPVFPPLNSIIFPRYPLTNITPFTYRDGWTFLELVEALRTYVTKTLVVEVDERFAALVASWADALEQVQEENAENLATIQAMVDAINNKSGMVDVQHYLLTDDFEFTFNPLWPKNLPVFLDFVQDATGNHSVTFPEDVIGVVSINPKPNSRTLVALYPQPTDLDPLTGDQWRVAYLDDSTDRIYRRWYSVMEFGAYGDGIHDDAIAIQTAADFVFAFNPDATLYFPPGTYRTESTVSIKCSVEQSGATIKYYGILEAVILGDQTNYVIQRKTFNLPRIVNQRNLDLAQFDGTSIGVRAINLNSCELRTPFIQAFEEGLVLEGLGQGFVYTNVYPLSLWANHRNMIMRPKNLGGTIGWVNQNQIIGGRMQSPDAWGIADDTESNQLNMEQPSGSSGPNNNTFIGTSFEGPNRSMYRVEINGRFNQFINCRWENAAQDFRVRYGAFAHYNELMGGYDLDDIEETFVAGSTRNIISQRNALMIANANTIGAKTFNNTSDVQVVDTWATISGFRFTHSAGVFTLRPGIWTVEARILLDPAVDGRVQVHLQDQAGVDLDIESHSVVAGTSPLGLQSFKVSRRVVVDGTTVTGVRIAIRNFTGDTVAIVTGAGFNGFTAIYQQI